MLEHLVLGAAVVLGATLARTLRRQESGPHGYSVLIGGLLALAGFAALSDLPESRFLGVVVVGLTMGTVVLPFALEQFARLAFARGQLALMAGASALRAMLMPGSGLNRQIPILQGLALLDREGVDSALAHFNRLAQDTEDGGELAVIHEQIISMLFYGQRWNEGIAHYERRFHPGYAALRPSLALGLLRAYGEADRLSTAAGLLRALEGGPLGKDPRGAELLGQARMTFLAYVGASGVLDEVVERRQHEALGITPATAHFFLGVAFDRAGDVDRARHALERVEVIAGAKDGRVLEASRYRLRRVGADEVEALDPETGEPVLDSDLRRYALAVSTRLRRWLEVTTGGRPARTPLVTYAIMAGFVLVHAIWAGLGRGGIGLLTMGGLEPGLIAAGSHARLLTAPWVHADLLGMLFDLYTLWLAGQVVEVAMGRARMLLASVGAAVAGLAASVWLAPALGLAPELSAVGGGYLVALGSVAAALWTLLPSRTPHLPPRARRNLLLTLGLLLIANVVVGIPAAIGSTIHLVAPVSALVVATGVAFLPNEVPTWARRLQGSVGIAFVVATAAAWFSVVSEPALDRLEASMEARCQVGGIAVPVTSSFRAYVPQSETAAMSELGFDLPLYAGLVDGLAFESFDVVQILAVPGHHATRATALFELDPALEHEVSVRNARGLPPRVSAVVDRLDARAVEILKNGEGVATVIERPMTTPDGPRTLIFVASPTAAFAPADRLYARALADAAPAENAQLLHCDPL